MRDNSEDGAQMMGAPVGKGSEEGKHGEGVYVRGGGGGGEPDLDGKDGRVLVHTHVAQELDAGSHPAAARL